MALESSRPGESSLAGGEMIRDRTAARGGKNRRRRRDFKPRVGARPRSDDFTVGGVGKLMTEATRRAGAWGYRSSGDRPARALNFSLSSSCFPSLCNVFSLSNSVSLSLSLIFYFSSTIMG